VGKTITKILSGLEERGFHATVRGLEASYVPEVGEVRESESGITKLALITDPPC
jgi:hypothetical protein